MTLELLKPHTHAGKRRVAGERLELNDASARWLIAQGIAKQVEEATDQKTVRRDPTTQPKGD